MTLLNADAMMRGLNLLEERIKWVACPQCSEEVSKLRPCVYWEKGAQCLGSVCLECAESVKGLTFLAQKFPAPGVDLTFELLPVASRMGTKYITEKSYRAKVAYGNWFFWVYAKGQHLATLEDRKSPDQEKLYDNTFQVWMALKTKFEKGDAGDELLPLPKKTWGKAVLMIAVMALQTR